MNYSVQFLDEKGNPAVCYICGKPATALYNIWANAGSSAPSNLQPVCDEHNPMPYEVHIVPRTPPETVK